MFSAFIALANKGAISLAEKPAIPQPILVIKKCIPYLRSKFNEIINVWLDYFHSVRHLILLTKQIFHLNPFCFNSEYFLH